MLFICAKLLILSLQFLCNTLYYSELRRPDEINGFNINCTDSSDVCKAS